MDNTIIPYTTQSGSSESELDDSSSDDERSHLLSNNIGVHYNNFVNQRDFLNMENVDEYKNIRNKYFTPELTKHRILIDSKSVDHSLTHSTSNYNILFNDDNSSSHQSYKNVIGFRLIKAIIPNSAYTVNNNNKNIKIITNATSNIIDISLVPGSYTFTQLGDHLENILNTDTNINNSNFVVDKNETTFKYTIRNTDGSFSFRFLWNQSVGLSWKLFGFFNLDQLTLNTSFESDNVVQQNIPHVDLVIPEIPYIACKKNPNQKHIIERIPIDVDSGTINHYSNDINLDNYFYPIKINNLNIQLYDDSGTFLYDCQNNDNSFEFELTILNNN